MKKSLKTLLVMAVVLVVLGGAAVALWLTAPEPEVEEESSSSTPSYPVIDREAADVESISIESDAGDFTIVPLEDGETSSASSESSASAEDEDSSSSAASTTANNVGALTDLYGSFLGKPVIKVASTVYALKSTAQSFMSKRVMQQPNKGE